MENVPIKAIIWAIVIVASLLGPLIERWMRRRKEARGEAPPPGPEPEEPKLPYEDLVDQLFSPYIEKRKEEHAAKQRAAAPVPGPAPDPKFRILKEEEPEIRILEESPAPAIHSVPVLQSVLATAAAPQVVPSTPPPPPSLDERIFRNPRLSTGARLVLCAEILGRPGGRRPRR